MALLKLGRATKIAQATHHQGGIHYGATAGIQCSCISLMSVCWSTFISATMWDGTDLDMILGNGDRLLKSLNLYRSLGVDDLPRSVDIYIHSVDIFSLDKKASETTLNTYLVSLKRIIESCLKIGSVALFIKSGYIFGILFAKNYFYLFDSHSKDDKGNISQNGTFILVKFETLDDLEDYIKLKQSA